MTTIARVRPGPTVTLAITKCPGCGGTPVFMGVLFESVFSRCEDCGRQFMTGKVKKARQQ